MSAACRGAGAAAAAAGKNESERERERETGRARQTRRGRLREGLERWEHKGARGPQPLSPAPAAAAALRKAPIQPRKFALQVRAERAALPAAF